MAAGFWRLTAWLAKSPLAGFLTRLEPYAFFLFCSHAIVFNFAGIVFRRFLGNYGSELFPITFFTLPVLAVIAAVIGLLPVSGIPLPFISFGGSALVFTMVAAGILGNVARQAR